MPVGAGDFLVCPAGEPAGRKVERSRRRSQRGVAGWEGDFGAETRRGPNDAAKTRGSKLEIRKEKFKFRFKFRF
jgi:hypothetical protein